MFSHFNLVLSRALPLKKTWFFDLSKTDRDSLDVRFRSLAIFLKATLSAEYSARDIDSQVKNYFSNRSVFCVGQEHLAINDQRG